MAETRTFTADDVLSITTGRLVSTRLMDGVYDILGFLTGTGEHLYTHQLGRASETVRPWLLAEHPELDLEDRYGPSVFDGLGPNTVLAWLETQIAKHGVHANYELVARPEYAMSFADPIGDLANMQKPVHVVVTDEAS